MSEMPGIVLQDFDSDGNLRVTAAPLSGTEKYLYLPNLCDPTTWWYTSTPVSQEALVDSGDLTTWNSSNTNWIDLVHGKVFGEDHLLDPAAGGDPARQVLVEISINAGATWTPQTENSWGLTDGDYSVDYALGKVTFNAALGAGTLVRASYHRMVDSTYVIAPLASKRLKVLYIEVQYTDDVVLPANVVFRIRGNVEVFAPEQWDGFVPPGPLPAGTKVPLVQQSYKRVRDFFTESTGPFPVTPAHGGVWVLEEVTGIANIQTKLNSGYYELGMRHDGANWIALMKHMNNSDRALHHPLLTIPFRYMAFRDLRSSVGLEICVHIEGDQPLGGEFANVTAYCLTETE